MLIYFAAPLFSQAELHFNQYLTEKLESLGYSPGGGPADRGELHPPLRGLSQRLAKPPNCLVKRTHLSHAGVATEDEGQPVRV